MLDHLKTTRLHLRPVRAGDAAFLAQLFGDAQVMAHIGSGVLDPDAAHEMLVLKAGAFALYGYGNWTVCLRDTGAPIGEFGFFDARRAARFGLDGAVEAGWSFLPEQWGQGYATEAVAAAHRWFDGHFAGRDSFVIIAKDNPASLRVAEKCGYGDGRAVDHEGVENHVMRRAALLTE